MAKFLGTLTESDLRAFQRLPGSTIELGWGLFAEGFGEWMRESARTAVYRAATSTRGRRILSTRRAPNVSRSFQGIVTGVGTPRPSDRAKALRLAREAR